MIDLQFVNQFMYENFERVTPSKGGTHFQARCLLCGDSKKSLSKKRFHLDWKNGEPVWRCWNCNQSGGFLRLYMLVKGVSYDEAKNALHRFNPSRMKKTLQRPSPIARTHKIDDAQVGYNKILNDCVSESTSPDFSVQTSAWQKTITDFRDDRKIPNEIELYYAYQGKYGGRLIIPIFDRYKNVLYFQARRLPGSGIEPKYKNPPAQKSLVIYNENVFRNDLYIIVAEGLTDAFSVGNQGTTCLGKSISDGFLDKLFELTNLGIIIVFDDDMPGRKSLLEFMFGNKNTPPNKYSRRVKYFLMPKGFCECEKPCKDINILSTKHEIGDVYDFIVRNSYSFTKAFVNFKLGGM